MRTASGAGSKSTRQPSTSRNKAQSADACANNARASRGAGTARGATPDEVTACTGSAGGALVGRVVLLLGRGDRGVILRLRLILARLLGVAGLRFAVRLGDIVRRFRARFVEVVLRIGDLLLIAVRRCARRAVGLAVGVVDGRVLLRFGVGLVDLGLRVGDLLLTVGLSLGHILAHLGRIRSLVAAAECGR